MFGTWNPAIVMLQRTAPGGLADMARGLVGLVADHQYGLLASAPVFAFSAFGAARSLRGARAMTAAGLATVIGVLVMASAWVWWGGDAAPARFLTVVLPVLAVWLAQAWAAAGAGGRRALLLALAISAAFTVGYVTIDGGARAYAFPDGRGSIFEAFSPSVDLSLALPSLFREGDRLPDAVTAAMVWLAGAALAVWIATRVRADREGTALGLAGVAVLAVGGLTAHAAWAVAGTSPWTPAAGAAALLRRLPSSVVAMGGETWRPRGAATAAGALALRTPESVPVRGPIVLYLPNVPAGSYRIETSGADADHAFVLELGRDAWPYAEWRGSGPGPRVELSTALHSIRVSTEAPAVSVWLRPERVHESAIDGEARRVTRLSGVDVYSMDDGHYVDRSGLWTGGDRSTRLVLVPPAHAGAVTVEMEAGPTPVRVRFGEASAVALNAHARHRVTLTRAAGEPIELPVEVRGGFPASAIGAPSDSRVLGVWLGFSPGRR
jgi:hypothetical protein